MSAKLGSHHWLFKIKRKEWIYNITEAEPEDFIWLRKRKTSRNLEFWSINQFWEFSESSCGGKVENLDFFILADGNYNGTVSCQVRMTQHWKKSWMKIDLRATCIEMNWKLWWYTKPLNQHLWSERGERRNDGEQCPYWKEKETEGRGNREQGVKGQGAGREAGRLETEEFLEQTHPSEGEALAG